MRYLLLLLFILPTLFIFSDEYLITKPSEISQKNDNRFTKKNINMGDGLIHHYYYYNSKGTGTGRDLFIIFHGGRNNAEDFLRNTSLHRIFERNKQNILIFDSYGDADWFKNKKQNEKIINFIFRNFVRSSNYNKIYLIGYTEGATFMSDLYCDGLLNRIDYIWNFNGNKRVDCDIDGVGYNLFYGDKMNIDMGDKYYSDYNKLAARLYQGKKCIKQTDVILNGSLFSDVYLEKPEYLCESENKNNIFIAKGMSRNFPINNGLEMDDFEGATLSSFDFYKFILNY